MSRAPPSHSAKHMGCSVSSGGHGVTCVHGAGAPSISVGEVRLEEFEGSGHIGPAKADADMIRLVIDRARQEQDADLGEPGTVAGEVMDPSPPAISATAAAATPPATHWAVRTLIRIPRHRLCPRNPRRGSPAQRPCTRRRSSLSLVLTTDSIRQRALPHRIITCSVALPAAADKQATPTSSSCHHPRSSVHPSPADRHRIAFGNAGGGSSLRNPHPSDEGPPEIGAKHLGREWHAGHDRRS